MHEYAITKELLRLSREEASKNKINSVKTVVLVLGKLSGFEAESILYYFNELKLGGDYLSNATLEIEEKDDNTIKIVSIIGE